MVTLSDACDDPKRVEFSVDNLNPYETSARKPKWAEYVKGVVANFHSPLKGNGFDAVIATAVPIGEARIWKLFFFHSKYVHVFETNIYTG